VSFFLNFLDLFIFCSHKKLDLGPVADNAGFVSSRVATAPSGVAAEDGAHTPGTDGAVIVLQDHANNRTLPAHSIHILLGGPLRHL
jgi:hypothetical protein